MYKATVNVTLRKSILDPQGKAAHHALQNLGMKEIDSVRIGKFIEMDIDAENKERAHTIAENACAQLLANEVMEDFNVTIHENSE
ncbi:MAG TPA: phosphoribosylformylglycinamidine synthase subunit PurS [Halalkalibaculum sp.]|nr:phosphoribosylformylglycinamidine synthase subunit PurS [Halalkalibaculum sp.]